jgi:hypothetical protein
MLDLDNIWKIKWLIMLQIVGMHKYKWVKDGLNVLVLLIDQLMICNIILLDQDKDLLQLVNLSKQFLLKLPFSMLINKLLENNLKKILNKSTLLLTNFHKMIRRNIRLNLIKRDKSSLKLIRNNLNLTKLICKLNRKLSMLANKNIFLM